MLDYSSSQQTQQLPLAGFRGHLPSYFYNTSAPKILIASAISATSAAGEDGGDAPTNDSSSSTAYVTLLPLWPEKDVDGADKERDRRKELFRRKTPKTTTTTTTTTPFPAITAITEIESLESPEYATTTSTTSEPSAISNKKTMKGRKEFRSGGGGMQRFLPTGDYVAQQPPPDEGGCTTRNIDGEWITHYKESLFRVTNRHWDE